MEDAGEQPGELHRAGRMEGCSVPMVFPDILSSDLHTLSAQKLSTPSLGFPWGFVMCMASWVLVITQSGFEARQGNKAERPNSYHSLFLLRV